MTRVTEQTLLTDGKSGGSMKSAVPLQHGVFVALPSPTSYLSLCQNLLWRHKADVLNNASTQLLFQEASVKCM